MSNSISQYASIIVNALVLLTGQLLIKRGLGSYGRNGFTEFGQIINLIHFALTTPVLLLGYFLSLLSGLLWVITLARLPLSYAVPLFTGIYYVLLLIMSILVLGETVSRARWLGAGLILVGVIFLVKND